MQQNRTRKGLNEINQTQKKGMFFSVSHKWKLQEVVDLKVKMEKVWLVEMVWDEGDCIWDCILYDCMKT